MPRSSRLTEMPQRPSPRGPPSIRTSSSNSDPTHHRTRTERNPRLADGRSPRGAQSDPLHQKKLGTRIADLESQLGQAQVELKSLKNQLVSAEAAKKAAQEQLEKKSKKQPKVRQVAEIQERHSTAIHSQKPSKKVNKTATEDLEQETDVFEVPIEKLSVESEIKLADQNEVKPESVYVSTESPAKLEQENSSVTELESKNGEINVLKTRSDERGKELDGLRRENESLKGQLDDKVLKISSAESAIEELTLRLRQAEEELEKTKTGAAQINKKLEAADKAKEELETEMRRLRVQTEQWRKAADAAASVLAGEVETINARQISERCGSMDKHYGNSGYEHVGGYTGYVGSPGLMDDADDVFGSGKRRGSGMKMFGDLWKKKGHK